MATAREYYEKAVSIMRQASQVDGDERQSLNMKAASFYQMAIKSSPEPFPDALGELSQVLLFAGDENCVIYAKKAVAIDPTQFEARWVLCITELESLAGHQRYSPNIAGFINDPAAGLTEAVIFGPLSLLTGAKKTNGAHNAIQNLAEAYRENIKTNRVGSDYCLMFTNMMLILVEMFGYRKDTSVLLESIQHADWSSHELTEEQKNTMDDFKMQAEGTVLMLK